jgi:NAD(P)H-dependent FMN reductase
MFENKPMILLAAAPGPRGGATVLQTAVERFPRHGARVIGSMALPRFKEAFHAEQGLVDPELRKELDALITSATALI